MVFFPGFWANRALVSAENDENGVFGIDRTLLMLHFKSSETADPSAETVPEICPKSRKTRSRVFGPNPHCTVHFGGAAPRPPMFCGIVRTLLMLRFKNAKSQILVRKRSRKFVREPSESSPFSSLAAIFRGTVESSPSAFSSI